MPEWIHDLSCWLFYSEHSADWWMVVVTSVAVIAAIWAGRAAYEQLQLLKRQVETDSELSNQQLRLLGDQVLAATRSVEQAQVASEKQLAEMEAARKDSLRPVLWPKAARLVQVRGQTRLVLTIANVGPGPSIRAQADVWFYPADPEDPAGEKASLAYSKERDAPRAGLVLDHPIGTGDEAEGYVHSPTDPEIEETALLNLTGLEHVLTFVVIRYTSVHGTEHVFPDRRIEILDFQFPTGLHARMSARPLAAETAPH